MIAGLVILIIIIITVLQQYLKAEAVRSFLAFVSAICGMMLAMSYYESVSAMVLSKGFGGVWAAPGCLILIFVISFAVIYSIGQFFLGASIHFSVLVDRGVSCLFGGLTALIISGILLIAVGMTPIPGKWTYSRFDTENFDIDNPSPVFVPADSIVSGLFAVIDSGSMKTRKNFASLHPNFTDQIHLNKINNSEGVLSMAGNKSLAVNKNSVWIPADIYKDSSTGEIIDKDLTMVRVGVKSGTVKEGGAMDEEGNLNFTLAQFRLIAVENPVSENRYGTGTAKTVYPVGYVKGEGVVDIKKDISEVVKITRSDFKKHEGFGNVMLLDLVFEMPRNHTAVAIAFRDFAIAELSKPVQQDQIAGNINFIQLSKCSSSKAEIVPSKGSKIKALELTANENFLLGLKLDITLDKFDSMDIQETEMALDMSDNAISCATLKILPDEKSVRKSASRRAVSRGLPSMLNKMDGYNLLALKCSEPKSSDEIESAQFPVLLEIDGTKHHPVGLVCGGRAGSDYIYQLDFCSLDEDEVSGGLKIQNGVVAEAFSKSLWLPSEVDKVSELYFLYMIKNSAKSGGGKIIITSVQSGSKGATGFKDCDGFAVTQSTQRRRRR